MKKPHNRKLLLLLFDETPHTIQLPPAPPSFTFTNSPLPHLQPNTTVHNATSPSSSPLTKKPLKTSQPSPAFDSSMALTLLVLLIALFFMGFFSIYIRRFDDDSTVDISRRRRHRHHHHRRDPPHNSSSPSYQPSMLMTLRRGLDPAVVRSLPVYAYRGDAKYQIECLICLGEFEEKETVKMIPFCKHVFHLRCIDTWFALHVTCPVCRGTQLFEEVKKSSGLGVVVEEGFDQGVSELNGRSTIENGDTCIEVRDVGSLVLRRANSCSNLSGERVLLQRASSF